MAIHRLQRSQVIRASTETCWRFFSDPRNLALITPASMGFEVLSELPEQMHSGLLIEYRVRPLWGIPVTWLTEITHVDAPRYFVDEQRIGPYRLWHHEHFFQALPNGEVEIRDRVHYSLPFGSIGDLVGLSVVRAELDAIFSYREKAIAERFPGDLESSS